MNYYDILGVDTSATERCIKRAFRIRAKRLHPDINTSTNAKADFQRVNEAYQVLVNTEKRRIYDLRLTRGLHTRRVYYRPAGAAYRSGDTYRYSKRTSEHTPTRFERIFDQFLFFFMLMAGLGPLVFGIFRLTGEPVEGVNPFLGIFFGVVFTGLFLFVWDKKQRLGS